MAKYRCLCGLELSRKKYADKHIENIKNTEFDKYHFIYKCSFGESFDSFLIEFGDKIPRIISIWIFLYLINKYGNINLSAIDGCLLGMALGVWI